MQYICYHPSLHCSSLLQQTKSREGSKRRRKSYVDVKFIDKDDGDEEEEEKKEDQNSKISPDALVDILA